MARIHDHLHGGPPGRAPRLDPGRDSPPRLSPSIVARSALLPRVRLASHGRLTLVVGPAGSGKSVLLAQLAVAEMDRFVNWCTFRSEDADARRLALHLVEALGSTGSPSGPELERHLPAEGGRLGDGTIRLLLDRLQLGKPSLVIFEDVHELDRASTEDLFELVARAPDHVQFVVSTRVDPGGSVARLELAGELVRFDQEDLALTADEEAQMVHRVSGLLLDSSQREALHERTEGWAAATQLSALAIANGSDVDASIAEFHGNDATLARFMMEEVVDKEPAELREFMVRTAVVDQICASLAQRLTGRDDAQAVLDDMERRSLLITGLDQRRLWFRYHPLFAQRLRGELHDRDPMTATELLRDAARWHLERGEPSTAGDLLVRAEDWHQLLAMVLERGWELYEGGYVGLTVRWARAVPRDVLQDQRPLMLLLSAQAQALGDVTTTAGLLDELDALGYSDIYAEASAHALRCSGAQYDAPLRAVLHHAEALQDWVRSDPQPPADRVLSPMETVEFLTPLALLAAGRAKTYLGEDDEARELLSRASEGHAFWSIRVGAIGSLGHLEARAGELGRATSMATEALTVAGQHELGSHECCTDSLLALAIAATERDDLPEAASLLSEAELMARAARRTAMSAMLLAQRCRWALGADEVDHALDEGEAFWSREAHRLDPAIGSRLAAALSRLSAAANQGVRAKELLADVAVTFETCSAAAYVAWSESDQVGLSASVRAWPSIENRQSLLELTAWKAVLAAEAGDPGSARSLIRDALEVAGPEGHLRTLIDIVPGAVDLVVDAAAEDPTMEVDELLAAASRSASATRSLTERELTVLRELATPKDNRKIAEAMSISENTLKTHLRHVYRKLGVASRREAVHVASSEGLLHGR